MNELLKNIEKLKEYSNKLHKVEENNGKNDNLYEGLYENLRSGKITKKDFDVKCEQLKNEEKRKQLEKKKLETSIEIAKNNIYIDFMGNFAVPEIKKLIEKYGNKNIGEKTREKIRTEFDNDFKEKYQCNLYAYMYWGVEVYAHDTTITFDFEIRENAGSYVTYFKSKYYRVDKYTEEQLQNNKYIDTEEAKKNCEIINGNYYNFSFSNNDRKIVNNIELEASRLLSLKSQAEEKIKKLNDEIEKIRKDYNELLFENTYDDLYIKSK